MIDIISGTRQFKLTPYERLPTPEEPLYDWIKVWVEFTFPGLNTAFSGSFTIVELKSLKSQLQTLYSSFFHQKKVIRLFETDMYRLVEDRSRKGYYYYKRFTLEVVVREKDWTITHFLYK